MPRSIFLICEIGRRKVLICVRFYHLISEGKDFVYYGFFDAPKHIFDMRVWAPRKVLICVGLYHLISEGKDFVYYGFFDAPKHIFDMRDWATKSRKMRKILPLNARTRAGYDILYFLE